MMASEGAALLDVPGVTIGGTGSHTSVSFGLGFGGVCAAPVAGVCAEPCGAGACRADSGSVSKLNVVTVKIAETFVRMTSDCARR